MVANRTRQRLAKRGVRNPAQLGAIFPSRANGRVCFPTHINGEENASARPKGLMAGPPETDKGVLARDFIPLWSDDNPFSSPSTFIRPKPFGIGPYFLGDCLAQPFRPGAPREHMVNSRPMNAHFTGNLSPRRLMLDKLDLYFALQVHVSHLSGVKNG